MTWLSTAFLIALPLAAAPILLHLFDRRRNVVIEWGAMQFLMEAATRRTSARRLKQFLLLLLRTLAVALLVVALAGPLMPGNWFGSRDRGETIFIVDNSMSMMRADGETTLLADAAARAVEQLDGIQPGDSVRILLASPYPVWATGGSVRVDSTSREVIADQLREIRATNGGSDLLSALFTAAQAEVDPTWKRRRIVLLTDGQQADWPLFRSNKGSEVAGWKRLRDVLETAEVPTRLDVIELEPASVRGGNVAVNDIHVSRTVVGVNQSFTLAARIQNHGLDKSAPSTAVWKAGDRVEHESHVPGLKSGASHDVVWKHSFNKTGVYSISCETNSDDDLQADNNAVVVVEVVDEVPVLVVESSPGLAELQRDAFFVQAALGWIDGEPLDARGICVPDAVGLDRLERMDLSAYRAIVLPNLKEISEKAAARLHEFVSNGGGLWIAAGPRTDVEAFNEHLFADGNGLAPLALDQIVDETALQSDSTNRPTKIDLPGSEHPATAELADADRLDVGDVTVSQRFRFMPPPQGEDVAVLLSLTNGEPLAVEKYVGRGRVIVQSVPLRLQWSELAKSQAFVVMVQDWLAYLTQPLATRHNLSPGDPISVHLADDRHRAATLQTPHGDEIELTADDAGEGVIFRSSRTILPGDYVLELGVAGDRIPFHVKRDPRESNLSPLAPADREVLAGVIGFKGKTSGTAAGGAGQANALWPTLLMILIGVLAAELLLSGIIARERFGATPIAETTEHWVERELRSPMTRPTESATAQVNHEEAELESAGML